MHIKKKQNLLMLHNAKRRRLINPTNIITNVATNKLVPLITRYISRRQYNKNVFYKISPDWRKKISHISLLVNCFLNKTFAYLFLLDFLNKTIK